MFRTILAVGLALLLPALAAAEPIVIATGKTGGGYDRRAREIGQRLEQRGLDVAIANLNGSDEISLALCAGRADMALLQVDAIHARSLEGCQMKAIGNYGIETALLLFPPRSKHDELSDLGTGAAVLVDTIGSGSDLFWRSIVRIETGEKGSGDGWANARIVNDPLELANASAEMGEIDAVVLVRKPDSADIQTLLGQGWKLGELWDRDISDLQFNGAALYRAEKFKVPTPGRRSVKVWGYEVRSFIAVSQAVATGDRGRFAALTAAAQ
ncbi:hypothetical protein LO749_06460 [Paracoccus denitrificans]|uniref:hypothetical protein n=1 Tax=Paracoccus denitrificans TaxID=266 RepID=UPI001E31417D|nr:hypothetical protein [Paracoccus denitrificans]UFS63829.1 hypothetical protein LO749_06460 [Paracoccus denitrificans]